MEPESPYSPPTEIEGPSPAELERKKRFWLRAVKSSIALIVIPPLIGIMMTVFHMMQSFQTLGDGGTTDRAALSAAIGAALRATAFGLIFSFAGLVLLIISLIRFFSYRSRFGKPTG